MTAPQDVKFEGWLAKSPESVKGNMEWGSFTPKKWTENDVDIEISHCGVCGTDIHALRCDWNHTKYPCVVGHEIVGKAVRVGNNVKHVKVGDRVGVGAQSWTCGECDVCRSGHSPYCPQAVNTYNDKYPNDEGTAYGGYADYNRAPGSHVFLIPEGLSSEHAAPLLCAGITVYSPLRQNGVGPGKTVGVIGIGGLGHLAVMFARAMGADRVVGISRKAEKRDTTLQLGAHEYIATADDADWVSKNRRTLDVIVSTVAGSNMPINEYLSLLRVGGTMVQVGAPDNGELPTINVFTLLINNIKIGGSAIGHQTEVAEMLQFAADKGCKPWVEKRPMKEANKAVVDMERGDVRYRFVLRMKTLESIKSIGEFGASVKVHVALK